MPIKKNKRVSAGTRNMDRILSTAQGINAVMAMANLFKRRKPKGKKNERYPAEKLRQLRAERGVGSKARRLRASKTRS